MNEKTCDLTLPGSIPGLLRRGSPVFVGLRQEPTVVREIDGSLVGVYVGWLDATDHRINLDLADATGRAHAAWWAMGLDYGCVLPLRMISSPFSDRAAVPCLTGYPQDAGWAAAKVAGHNVGTAVPSLTGLDHHDPRLLPDGSRWVDAEALRRVVLHVAGLGSSDD